MTHKFKVGDKVKCISVFEFSEQKVGEVYTVTKLCSYSPYDIYVTDSNNSCAQTRFELASTKRKKSKLKVGSRVTVHGGTERTAFDKYSLKEDNTNEYAFRYGDKGTVETLNKIKKYPAYASVLLDNGGCVSVSIKQLTRLVKKKKK